MDNIFHVFSERKRKLDALKKLRDARHAVRNTACPSCGQGGKTALLLCPKCGYHFPMPARARLDWLLDDGAPLFGELTSLDPIEFPGYAEKLAEQREKTGLSDAYCCREGTISDRRVIMLALEGRFLMGSMGTAMGEAVARAAERALEKRFPLIIFSASGGARMQEGMFSLMQMAKTSAAIRRFSDAGGLFVSVLTHPTTGGVTASFASLGDIILAEPGALIGFAGPRVIEQTIGAKLPPGFQRAEFQLKHGFVDAIVPRGELRETLARILRLHPARRVGV
jgi:acetyl-CoA carboxylase carboxyl transferase subunit beta